MENILPSFPGFTKIHVVETDRPYLSLQNIVNTELMDQRLEWATQGLDREVPEACAIPSLYLSKKLEDGLCSSL